MERLEGGCCLRHDTEHSAKIALPPAERGATKLSAGAVRDHSRRCPQGKFEDHVGPPATVLSPVEPKYPARIQRCSGRCAIQVSRLVESHSLGIIGDALEIMAGRVAHTSPILACVGSGRAVSRSRSRIAVSSTIQRGPFPASSVSGWRERGTSGTAAL